MKTKLKSKHLWMLAGVAAVAYVFLKRDDIFTHTEKTTIKSMPAKKAIAVANHAAVHGIDL